MKRRPPSHPDLDALPSPDTLPDLLARVDQWLAKHRPRFAKALLPGATPAECTALQSALGHVLPEELRLWLGWHNGQSPDIVGAFESSWSLLSTRQIAEVKKELDAEASANWHAAWIPFLDDDAGNYVCIDARQPGSPVRECWLSTSKHALIAPSLTAWVADVLAAMERGEYVEDPERGTFYRTRSAERGTRNE
jgi:cell wall assembly regulator SMI1